MEELTWSNEKRRLSDLVPWDKNPRQIDKEQARRLRQSLDEFGQVLPICIDPVNTIIDGHQRQKVWGMADKYGPGMTVDVRVASRKLTDQEQQKLTVFLEKAKGDWDFGNLANFFEVDDLLDWGFAEDELDLEDWGLPGDELEDPSAEMSKADKLQEKWQVKTGDLWVLGEHRLICGDCTDEVVVERLMGGEKAALTWTDPPYGVSYGDKLEVQNPMGYRVRSIENDDLSDGELEVFIREALSVCSDNSVDGAAIYVASPAGKQLPTLIKAFVGSGFEFRWHLVWVKDQIVLSRADYHFQHENILYGWKPNAAHKWTGDRKQSSCFFVDRPKRSDEHPTMKPIELVGAMLKNNTDRSGIVLEPFAGSGTTIMAAERLFRRCRAVEISPKYVSVCLERWSEMTGKSPELIETYE